MGVIFVSKINRDNVWALDYMGDTGLKHLIEHVFDSQLKVSSLQSIAV